MNKNKKSEMAFKHLDSKDFYFFPYGPFSNGYLFQSRYYSTVEGTLALLNGLYFGILPFSIFISRSENSYILIPFLFLYLILINLFFIKKGLKHGRKTNYKRPLKDYFLKLSILFKPLGSLVGFLFLFLLGCGSSSVLFFDPTIIQDNLFMGFLFPSLGIFMILYSILYLFAFIYSIKYTRYKYKYKHL